MAASNILVINSGSSSLKLLLLDVASETMAFQALAERLGTAEASLQANFAGQAPTREALPGADHAAALDWMLARLGPAEFRAVGHRVVHGGEAFNQSVLIDDAVLNAIRACELLAPLHNPANRVGIEVALSRFPSLPQVAVFDTAFHQTLPPRAYHYAIPYEFYQRYGVRRYGFHGTSHRYVAERAAHRLGQPLERLQLISAHLGNGCSACAIRHGQSVDTTMGLTPLEGLVMGTRSGDVDPNLHGFLSDRCGKSLREITAIFNHHSGLLGLSGQSNDVRVLLAAEQAGDERAALALDVFCYRLAKAVLGLCAGLERVDALIFTGGIGEHAPRVRAATLSLLSVLGPKLDTALNQLNGAGAQGRITQADSPLCALVVNTNEELAIARETSRLSPAN